MPDEKRKETLTITFTEERDLAAYDELVKQAADDDRPLSKYVLRLLRSSAE